MSRSHPWSTLQPDKDEGGVAEKAGGELSDDGLSIEDGSDENRSHCSTNSNVSIGIDSVVSLQQDQLSPLVEVDGEIVDEEEILVLDEKYRISRKEELTRQLMAEEARAKKERIRLLQQLDDGEEEEDSDNYMDEDRDFSTLISVRRAVLGDGNNSVDVEGEFGDGDGDGDNDNDNHHGSSPIMPLQPSGATLDETSDGSAQQEEESVKKVASIKTATTVLDQDNTHRPPTLGILDTTEQRVNNSAILESTKEEDHNVETSPNSTGCFGGNLLLKDESDEKGARIEESIPRSTHKFPEDAAAIQPPSKSGDLSNIVSDQALVSDGILLENEDQMIKSTGIAMRTDEKEDEGEEKKSLFYSKIRAGFQHVAKHYNKNTTNDDSTNVDYGNYDNYTNLYPSSSKLSYANESITSFATVNFIDYTSTSTSNTMAAELKRRRAWNRDKSTNSQSSTTNSTTKATPTTPTSHHLILNLYDKLSSTFQARNHSTLTSVAYNNVRTNAIDLIPRLPIRTQLMGAIVPPSPPVSPLSDPTSPTATHKKPAVGGRSLPTPISDPAEWHTGPFCHVYIAACSSQEHYRTRVRPAIQAFVSQIEGAGSGNAVAAGKASAAAVGVKSMKDGSVVAAAAAAAAAADDGNGGLRDGGGGNGVKSKGGRTVKREQVMAVSMAANQANNTAGRNYSCQYLIVVVPVDSNLDGNVAGSEGGEGVDGSTSGGMGLSLRGRLAAGRRALKGNYSGESHPPIISDSTSLLSTTNTSSMSVNTDNVEVNTVASTTVASVADSMTQDGSATSTNASGGGGEEGSTTIPGAPLPTTEPSPISAASSTATTNKAPTTIITATTTTNLSSKEHRELLRKFTQDFPNGRACLLSTLLSSSSQKKNWRGNHHQPHHQHRMTHEQYTRLLKEQEWRTFLRMLGTAVVAGFNDRIQNYDEELRRLDKSRSNHLRKKSSIGFIGNFDSNLSSADDQEDFNWSHYYLLKESLAFTYEQMQLPDESLREYEELEALVPVGPWEANRDKDNSENKEKNTITTMVSHGLDDLACGYKTPFRHMVANHNDHIRSIYYLIQQYLFMRQTYLLFLMKRPAAVVERFGSFLSNMVRLRMECCRINISSKHVAEVSSDGSDIREKEEIIYQKRAIQTEAWAVGTCWDVVSAAEVFFQNITIYPSSITTSSSLSITNLMENVNTHEDILPIHREILCNLSNVMNFAQARFLRLGDLEFTSSNLIRRAMADRPEDTLIPWTTLWGKEVASRNAAAVTHMGVTERGEEEYPIEGRDGSDGNADKDNTHSNNVGIISRENTERSFQDRYLQLTTAAIQLNVLAGRCRHATNLRAGIAEVHFLRREYGLAIQNMLLCIDVYDDGQGGACVWDTVKAWRLFRLACCQRASLKSRSTNDGNDVMEYLQTITRCFEPKLSPTATNAMPSKLRCLLQQDLETMVGIPAIVNYQLNLSPFFDIDIGLTMDQTTVNDGDFQILETNEVLAKKVAKTVCRVGDTVVMTVSITSNLPNTIEVDSVRALLSTLEDYEDAAQHMKHETKEETRYCNIMTEEKDVFCVFHVNSDDENGVHNEETSSVVIHPGQNSYKIHWIPMTVGQYILSSLQLQWKNAQFHHDPKYMSPSQLSNQKTRNNTLLGIDVHPSDPTQTIEMNPIFLIPGHVQIVRLVFCAGEDIVSGGTAELTCSNGLRVRLAGGSGGSGGSGEDIEQWEDRCCIELGQCEPRSQIVLVVSVKSDAIDTDSSHSFNDDANHRGQTSQQNHYQRGQGQGRQSYRSHDSFETYQPQTLQAKVITYYHHGLYTKLSASSICPCAPPMSAALEALITTLERPALTVNRVVAVPYAKDHVMISVTVHCNTPVSFSLKEWDIYFPYPLCLVEEKNEEIDGGGGDLNNGLFEKPVVEGEEIFFGFKCRCIYGHLSNGNNYDYKNNAKNDNRGEIISSSTNGTRPVLHVILKDEFGKTFRQVLPLDLDDLYNSMQQREEEHLSNSVGVSVSAALICAVQQGLVGTPVAFTYRIDVIMTAETNEQIIPSSLQRQQLLYQISCAREDWILGGKIRGSVDVVLSLSSLSNKKEEFSASFDLNFVGVPSKAGVLKHFPDVELSYLPSSNDYNDDAKSSLSTTVPRLELRSRYPDSFMSLAYKSHMALACLSPTSGNGMQ